MTGSMAGKTIAVLNTVVNLLKTEPTSPNLAMIKRHRTDWKGAEDSFPAAFVFLNRTTYRKYGPAKKVADYELKLVLYARDVNGYEQADEALEKLLDDGNGKGIEILFGKSRNVQIGHEHYCLELGDEMRWDQTSDGQAWTSICEMTVKMTNRLGGRSI